MKIWISGAFSVGKSTLIQEIKKYTDIEVFDETAREILEEIGKRPEDMTKEELNKLQELIVERQTNKEQIHSFITDTTLIEVLAYSKDLEVYNKIEKQIKEHYKKQIYDVLFYIPIEFEIEDDWLRHTNKEFQSIIDKRIRDNILKYRPAKEIIKITGTIEERIKEIKKRLT